MIVTMRKCKLPRSASKVVEYRSMKQFNVDLFLLDLSNVPWDSAFVFEDVDDIWTQWHKLFIEMIDHLHAPLKKKLIRGTKLARLTSEITGAISKRNRLHRKFVKNKSLENWEAYRRQRKLVTSLKRSALKTYKCIYKLQTSRGILGKIQLYAPKPSQEHQRNPTG